MARRISQDLQSKLDDGDLNYRFAETSYLGLRPGDVVQFSYSGSFRYGLIVASKRTSDGMFLSSRNNTLINVVTASALSSAMFSLMINNLYNKENKCTYQSPSILKALLGRQNFRTFNVSKMRDIIKVNIDG